MADEHAWFQLQERFLTGHHYWTATASALRTAPKEAQLASIRARLASWPAAYYTHHEVGCGACPRPPFAPL